MLLPLAGVAAAAMAAAGYQSMSPTGQWYGPTFTGMAPGSKQLALTYDDGPNDPHTLRLLEVLEKRGVKATFFLIGRYVEARPDIVRALVSAGHAIGNHTYTHPNLIFTSRLQTRTQLQECGRAIQEATGVSPKLFRPPFGGRLRSTLQVVRALGMETVMWNASGRDWEAPAARSIEERVSAKVRGGNIILLHDGGHKGMGADRSHTVAATDLLIVRHQDSGHEFVTVPEMMRLAGASPASAGG